MRSEVGKFVYQLHIYNKNFKIKTIRFVIRFFRDYFKPSTISQCIRLYFIFLNIFYLLWSDSYFWKLLFLFQGFLYFPGMFENPAQTNKDTHRDYNLTYIGLGKVPLTKQRFSKINRRVRSRTAKTVNFQIVNKTD